VKDVNPRGLSRHSRPRQVGAGTGFRDWPSEKAAGAGRGQAAGRESTTVPGIERAPNPAVSRAWGTWKPRQGPGSQLVSGKPEATKAETRGGSNLPKKRTPVAERRQEPPGPHDWHLQPVAWA